MGMEVGEKGTIRSEMNVVPLIDIVLVLLIIFMVVTPMLQKGKPVMLPTGQDPGQKPDSRDDVIVSIAQDELIFITGDESAIPIDVLEQKLRELNERAPSTPLFVKADRRLNYGAVKKVMLTCETAGFKSISLVAEKPK